MTAVIESGGKQFKVSEGDIIYIEKVAGQQGDNVQFDKVLSVFDGNKSKFGTPYVSGVTVTGKLIKQGRSKKIIVYKMKPKKTYRRKQGHRQAYTKVQISTISIVGKED